MLFCFKIWDSLGSCYSAAFFIQLYFISWRTVYVSTRRAFASLIQLHIIPKYVCMSIYIYAPLFSHFLIDTHFHFLPLCVCGGVIGKMIFLFLYYYTYMKFLQIASFFHFRLSIPRARQVKYHFFLQVLGRRSIPKLRVISHLTKTAVMLCLQTSQPARSRRGQPRPQVSQKRMSRHLLLLQTLQPRYDLSFFFYP